MTRYVDAGITTPDDPSKLTNPPKAVRDALEEVIKLRALAGQTSDEHLTAQEERRLADKLDQQAEVEALRAGKKAPDPVNTEAANRKLTEASRRMTVARAAEAEAAADLRAIVEEHADAWRNKLVDVEAKKLLAAEQAIRDAIEAVGEYSDVRATAAWAAAPGRGMRVFEPRLTSRPAPNGTPPQISDVLADAAADLDATAPMSKPAAA